LKASSGPSFFDSGATLGTVDEEKLEKEVEAVFDADVKKVLEFFGKLIDAGADVHAQVDKLFRYRNTKASAKKGKKKDVEGDVEMKSDNETADSDEESSPELNTDDESEPEDLEEEEPAYEEFDSEDDLPGLGLSTKKQQSKHTKVWDFETNSFVIKEYGNAGLWTCLHFAVRSNNPSLIEFLLARGADVNKRNWNGDIPLQLAFEHGDTKLLHQLIDAGSNVNNINKKGANSLLETAKFSVEAEIIEKLLSNKAEPNLVSYRNRTILKSVVASEDVDRLGLLIKHGADVNFPDKKQRTALHHAINHSSASGDATFDTEHLLLKNSADVNAVDALGRTPLHYAFVKIGDHKDVSNIDPIEAVSSLCAIKGIKLNVQDRWGKSPLHYASQRGATCAAVHLINKGATADLTDNDGNTPLGIAFMRGHSNYAFVLIQNKASVNSCLNFCPQKEWKSDEKVNSKKHQKARAIARNTFGMFGRKSRRAGFGYNPYGYNNNYGNSGRTYMEGDEELTDDNNYSADGSDMSLEYGTYSFFRIAVHRGWQGIAYMLLDYKYDYMRALQDAMIEQKFKLVHTLLSKDPDGEVLRNLNEEKQNLIHIMGIHGKSVDQKLATSILDDLSEKGLDLNMKDASGKSPLHHAAANHFLVMLTYLLEKGANVNDEDNDQHTPLALAIKDDGIYSANDTVKELQEKGANMNIHVVSTIENEKIRVTPLLQAIAKDVEDPEFKMVNSMLGLGCDVNAVDEKGRNAIIYAIRMNNEKLLEFLLKSPKVTKDVVDNDGKTAVHHVVNPRTFGSFENVKILKCLASHKFPLNEKDQAGKVPMFYAQQQESEVMAKALKKLGAKDIKSTFKRAHTSVPMKDWADSPYDINGDCKAYVKKLEKSAKKKAKPEEKKIQPYAEGGFSKIHEVVYEEDSETDAYDAIMSKIDVKNGHYSENLFYQMQLIKDTNRDMYILFTRWGRIGSPGQFQKTPFGELEEAVKEFKKVFKQKSGNEWDEREDFEKKHRKFQLLKFEKTFVAQEEMLTAFDLEKCPKSDLSDELQSVMGQVVNTALYVKSMSLSGIDTDLLPMGKLAHETITKAEGFLKQISAFIKEKNEIAEDLTKAGAIEKLWGVENKIYDLSSRFYEIIPHKNFVNTPIPPIDNERELETKLSMIKNLGDFELVSRMLLGAHNKKKEVNPMDYVLSALNVKLEALDKESEEFRTLMEYIKNTSNETIEKSIKNIFVLQRRGEAENFQKWKKLANKKLLFHGSKVSNFMGIMSQGLKIAPAWAPSTGLAYGKGIYLADMFSKSQAYCDDYQIDPSIKHDKFMLMCEAALGKPFKTSECLDIEKAKKGYHSTEAIGSTKPDPDSTIILPNGCSVPVGKLVDIPNPRGGWGSYPSEYIVYEESQVRLRYIIQFEADAGYW